ncbi:MAG TPA: hypothetical protein VJK09_02355 [Candidatus Paceibacterota bacterium]
MNKGIISIIAIFIVLIILASAFKVNLRGYIDSSPEQALDNNVILIIQTGKVIWSDYIYKPLATVWNGYIMPFFKGQWLGGLKTRIQEGTTLSPG